MVKSGKRKNAGIGIDFKRAKHKVGRKLAAASNATDTTISSASITLGQQSMAVDRAGQAVTERNLTLKETLAQCSHYSERVRRDALEGLAQLAAADPGALRRGAAAVVDAAAARLSDPDAGVRTALRATLRDALLPALGGPALAPFLPRLMAAQAAALTHLGGAVRADALRVLRVLAAAAPAALGPAYLPDVLAHFGALLSRSARGRTLEAGSLASLGETLQALEDILRRAAEYRTLAWTECGAESLAAEPAELPATCLGAITRCISMLLDAWGTDLAGDPAGRRGSTSAALILLRVAPVLPIPRPGVAAGAATLEALVQLNVAGADLLLRFLPQALPQARGKGGGGPSGDWAPRLLAWTIAVLERDGALGGRQGSGTETRPHGKGKGAAGPSLAPGVYSSVLQGMARALPLLPAQERRALVAAVAALTARSPPDSTAAAAVTALWAPLIADPARSFHNSLPDGEPLVQLQDAMDFIQTLPRALWTLGHAHPNRSMAMLQVLLDAARLASPDEPMDAMLGALQPQLLVLWGTVVSPQGKKGGAARLHVGPLAALGAAAQACTLAADTLAHSSTVSPLLLKTASWVALTGTYPTATSLRLVENTQRQLTGMPDTAPLLALLAALLTGEDGSGLAPSADPERSAAMADAACEALARTADPGTVLAALLPGLEEADACGTYPQRARRGMLAALLRVAAARPGALPPAACAAAPRLLLAAAAGGNVDWATGAAAGIARAVPGALPALLQGLAQGQPADALLPGLRLLLALLEPQDLAQAMLAQGQQLQAALRALRQAITALHAADPVAAPATEYLARCAARSDVLLGVSTLP